MSTNPNSNNPSYEGPQSDYQPEKGNLRGTADSVGPFAGSFNGYHDLGQLKELLKEIKELSERYTEECESRLTNFTVSIKDDEKVSEAQKVEWPSELGETKDYISYYQYKALRNSKSRGADYLRKTYEKHTRGPKGSTCIDAVEVYRIIKTETERIEAFIDEYIGQVDDSSEYRVLELFQDWSYSALKYLRNFWAIVAEEEANDTGLPKSEITSLSKTDAADFQALFKVKGNLLDQELLKVREDFVKEFDIHSDVFYKNFLGPALKFRLKYGRNLSKTNTSGILENQANQALVSLKGNFDSALANLMSRNSKFEKTLSDLEVRLKAKSFYMVYIRDLETVGRKVKNPFVEVTHSSDEKTYFEAMNEIEPAPDLFNSSHSMLGDVESADAHTQYILRDGGSVLSDLYLADGVKVGGMRPSTHQHLGTDGTERLLGDSIEPGSVDSAIVDRTETICVPDNLRVVSQADSPDGGATKVVQLAWDASELCEVEQFEIQVVQLTTAVDTGCVDGWVGPYPDEAAPCQPWSMDKVYLNVGRNCGSETGEVPLHITSGYDVTHAEVVAMDEFSFVSVMDFNSHEDIQAQVSVRTNSDSSTLKYRNIAPGSATVAGSSDPQESISAARLNDTDLLVGAMREYNSGDAAAFGIAAGTYHTVSLLRVTKDVGVTPPTASIARLSYAPVNDATWTSHGGVQKIAPYTNGQHFAVAYIMEAAGIDYGWVRLGNTAKNPGGSTRDVVSMPLGSGGLDFTEGYPVTDTVNTSYMDLLYLNSNVLIVLYDYNGSYVVRSILVSGGAVTDLGDKITVVSAAKAAGKPKLTRVDGGRFMVTWAQKDISSCDTADQQALLIQAYQIDSYTTTAPAITDLFSGGGGSSSVRTYVTYHTIDSSLNMNYADFDVIPYENSENYYMFAVVWGSTFNEPLVDVTSRGKLALLTWSAVSNRFEQETFDIPINIPGYNTAEYNGISLGQLGSSQHLVVGGGAKNDLVSYDQDTDTFLTTWFDDPALFHTGVNAYIVDICSSNQDFYGA